MEEDVFDCIYPFVGGIVSASLLLFCLIIHLPLSLFFKKKECTKDKLPLWGKATLEMKQENETITLWIARDLPATGTGNLILFPKKPVPKVFNTYTGRLCTWQIEGDEWNYQYLWHNLFPSVTFENSPQQIELKLIKP